MQGIEETCTNDLGKIIGYRYNYFMQICFHILEQHIKIPIILGFDNRKQFDDVIMVSQLCEKNYLPESSLGIS